VNAVRLARFFFSAVVFLTCIPSTTALGASRQDMSLPLIFEENHGQAPQQYQYLSHYNGMETMFLRGGVDFLLPEATKDHQRLGMRFVGLDAASRVAATDLLKSHTNYLLGADSSRWIRAIPNYGQVEYKSIYPGVDLVFYGNGSKLEHDFQIAAGADPSAIRFRLEGAEGVDLSSSGDLQIHLHEGTLILDKPMAYQLTPSGRKPVSAAFAIAKNGEIKFQVGAYDRKRPLIIDPALSYATYLDKLSVYVGAIATDASGATYITGITFSSSYPVTSGAFQTACVACASNQPAVFVTKLDATGTSQVYSTFLGGSAYSQSFGLAVDGNGNAVVVGYTQSTDFPVKNPVGSGTVATGTQFGFISSLTADGSALNYSSLLGGGNQPYQSSTTIANAVAVDAAGNAYISGTTDSPVFPVTTGALNFGIPQYPAAIAFVSKFVPAGTLGYSSLIGDVEQQNGGVGPAEVSGIAVDPQGSAYITGAAGALWPTTAGVYSRTTPGAPSNRSAFVTKLAPDASSLIYSTFLGAGIGMSVALDSNQDAFLTGMPDQPTFPVTSNAYLSTMHDCCAFLSELSPDGSQLLYSTFLGSNTGYGNIYSTGLSLDRNANIWVVGSTTDYAFPLLNPLQSIPAQSYLFPANNGFVSQFDPTGTTLKFSTFFGGNSPGVNGIALDANGKAHIAGTTASGIYTTPGAFEGSLTVPPQNVQYLYGYAALIDPGKDSSSLCLNTTEVDFSYVPVQTTATQTITVTNCGSASLSVDSIQSSDPVFTVPAGSNHCGSATAPGASCTLDITFAPTSSMSYSSTLTFTSNASIPTASIPVTGVGAVPIASLSSSSIPFSPLLVGQVSGPALVYIQNNGHANLTVDLTHTSINGDFAYTVSSCTSPISPGGTCFFNVTFGPTQSGNRTGTFTIVTNDPSNPTLAVALNGTAFAAYPIPSISSFDSPTIPVGTSPVNIQIFGNNFFPTSVVRINGQPQQTTYSSDTLLNAVVDPALRTALGELSVTVFNPTPGGGESASSTLTLYQSLQIGPSSVVSVPGSNLLYVAIPASAVPNANTIMPIDPATGTPGTPIPVGNDPRLLAPSDDGKYLYVALSGDQTVQRINLQTQTVERTFPFSPNPFCQGCSILAATDLHAVPGSPQEVVLAQGSMISLFNDGGLVNYTPTTYTEQIPAITSFAFAGDPLTIYSLPFTNSFFSIINLNNSGLSYSRNTGTNPGGSILPGSQVISDGTLLYTSAGQVWDPSTQAQVGSFPVTTYNATSYPNLYSLILDKTLGTIYGIGDQSYGSNSSALTISAYGQKSLSVTGTLAFPQVGYPDAGNLVRWGANGFAFIAAGANLTDQELYLTRSSVLAPTQPNPAPTLGAISPTSAMAGSSTLALALTGTNFIPTSTVTWNGAALQTTYISSTQLSAVVPDSDLTQSGTASVTVTNPAPGGGTSSALVFTIIPTVPKVSLSTSSVSFGDIALGASSSAQSITITNGGTGALSIASIAASGDFSQANNCGTTLAINATCQVSVIFTPTGTGQRTGALTITDNASGSPQAVSLTGNGTEQATISPGNGSSTTTTVSSGMTATYNLTLSGGTGLSGTVLLACTGAPQNASCSIAPSTLNLPAGGSANFTVTVLTAASQSAYLPQHSNIMMAGLGLLSLASVPVVLLLRRQLLRSTRMLCAIGAFIVLAALTGCGGGGHMGGTQQIAPAFTPPGSYTLTVTATAGNTTVAQKLTLIVQ
jgi:Abnormal spindle-like microcephaly-assoc'd, ASPM-SPD-2-Hydin/Beta-propeller repeat